MDDSVLPVSEREIEVLQLVATGASNQEIARDLVISVNTVKVHLRNIFEKLGVQSRTEATLYAIRQGWVVVDSTDAAALGPPQAAPAVWPSRPYLDWRSMGRLSLLGRSRGSSHAPFWADVLKSLHEAAANLTVLLIVLHVAGVLVSSVLHRENLIHAID